jgi:hypothetical protein
MTSVHENQKRSHKKLHLSLNRKIPQRERERALNESFTASMKRERKGSIKSIE